MSKTTLSGLRAAMSIDAKSARIHDLERRLGWATRLLQEAQDRGLEAGSEWADGVDAFLAGWKRRPPGVFPEWEAPEKSSEVQS